MSVCGWVLPAVAGGAHPMYHFVTEIDWARNRSEGQLNEETVSV